MMIVVQFLPTDENPPGNNIAAGVFGLKIAITPEVAHAIDDTGRENRRPRHLYGPDCQPNGAEQNEIDDQHQRHTFTAVLVVDILLHPVVRGAVTISFQGFPVLRFLPVKFRPFSQNLPDTNDLRAVGIIHRFALGVVLAVYRSPLLGHHARGQPQPESGKNGWARDAVPANGEPDGDVNIS